MPALRRRAAVPRAAGGGASSAEVPVMPGLPSWSARFPPGSVSPGPAATARYDCSGPAGMRMAGVLEGLAGCRCWPPADRRWCWDGIEALAVSADATQVPVKEGAGLVLLTLASGQFLMTLDSSVMNVSIATVAKDVGTTVTGIQTAITLYTLVVAMFMVTGGKRGSIVAP